MRNVGWAIRQVRKAQRITLEELAEAVGSDAGNLSRIERGVQNIPDGLLRSITARLGVPISSLWQIAETGSGASASVIAKIGKLTEEQLRQIDCFADFLLSRQTER